MFISYNPNPVKHTDDCVIRAIAKVTGVSWEKAYTALCLKGLEMYDLPNSNAVWGAYLREIGFSRSVIPNRCPDCYTIEDFTNDNPHGTFVIGTGTHAVAVIDGNFYDSYYSGDKIPMYVYRKE